ncbi:MAG: DNA repair protein RadC [Porphyromonas sp.]|nr:DNA repair protein RadC [Porphyromonas sp.]
MANNKEYPTAKYRITDLEESERPREKLLTYGPRALTNIELLAIQLGTGIRGTNAIELARQLLETTDNNLYTLYQELKSGQTVPIRGLGTAKKANILACLELGIRTMHDKEQLHKSGQQLTNSQMIYEYIYPDLYDVAHEELWLILLNQQMVTRRKIRIAVGGISSSTADIRVMLSTALRLEAPSLALVHNHPGGSLHPSSDDDSVTERLFQSCRMVGINMVDHLIFTDNGYYSYFDEGRLQSFL